MGEGGGDAGWVKAHLESEHDHTDDLFLCGVAEDVVKERHNVHVACQRQCLCAEGQTSDAEAGVVQRLGLARRGTQEGNQPETKMSAEQHALSSCGYSPFFWGIAHSSTPLFSANITRAMGMVRICD